MADRMTAADATALIDASWREWISAIESIPEARWSESGVCGEWAIKDLLGHVAVWDQVMIKYLGICARGEDPGDSIDWQAINDEGFAARWTRRRTTTG